LATIVPITYLDVLINSEIRLFNDITERRRRFFAKLHPWKRIFLPQNAIESMEEELVELLEMLFKSR
jgi:hypothetical protein